MESFIVLLLVIIGGTLLVRKIKRDNKRYDQWKREQESKKQIEKSHRDLPSNQEKQNIEQAHSQHELRNVVSPAAQTEREIEKPKNITITFPVVGLNYEGRLEKLTRIINTYKRNEYFHPLYKGYTDEMIKEGTFGNVYEINGSIEFTEIEREDSNLYDHNALKIIIKDIHGKKHHIGYVPSENCVEIRMLMMKYKMKVKGYVQGGKYKTNTFGYNDTNDEKAVVIGSKNYGLKVYLTFTPK